MKKLFFTRRKIAAVCLSYAAAAAIVFGGFICIERNKTEGYKRQVENGYAHAFSELVSEVGQMNSALKKCVYAGTPAMTAALCTDIYGGARAAKTALSELPLTDIDFGQTSAFIAKAGDYAHAAARKSASGEPLSGEEQENMKKLSDTAAVLSKGLTQLLAKVNDGELSMEELFGSGMPATRTDSGVSRSGNTAVGSIKELENAFPALPILIYDGLFSEHIARRKPELLTGLSEISPAEAAGSAAAFMDIKRGAIKYEGQREGKLPVYLFSASNGSTGIEVTKTGGYIVSVISSSIPQTSGVSADESILIAKRFLDKNSYHGMKPTGHITENNTVLVSFAYTKDGITFYPDSVCVRVSQDNGTVIGFEGLDYIMNHKPRDLPAVKITEDEAREKISKQLSVISQVMAVIPTEGKNEIFCYEFKCADESGESCIVYINAETGTEERVLVIQNTETGL